MQYGEQARWVRADKLAELSDWFAAKSHFEKGDSYCGLEKYAEAIACYEKSIAINPNDACAHSNLGESYAELGESTSSIACYRRAALLGDDSSRSALRSLGLSW